MKSQSVQSMTGIGTARGKVGSAEYLVDIRSVNNRHLDLTLRMPGDWFAYEIPIRSLVQTFLKRGKVTLSLSESAVAKKKTALSIDEAKIAFYQKELGRIAKKLKLEPLRLKDLLKLPDVMGASKKEILDEKCFVEFKKILEEALKSLVKSRQKEGENLKKDILARLAVLGKTMTQIAADREKNLASVHTELLAKVSKLSETVGQDPDRLSREVAYLAEKSDISEEIVRFRSHLELFEKTLALGAETGKKLDFILQELNREANTVASKAGYFKIAQAVIDIKTEIEKIREQIQNIE